MAKKGSQIIISLGDDGAIVSSFKLGRLSKRIFVTSPESSDFVELVSAEKDSSITLLLDTIDQNYIFSTIPNVGKRNVQKIVKRKMQNEFDKNDINANIFLGKDVSDAKGGMKYLFVSVRNSAPFTDWIAAVSRLPNKFGGIYLIPIESGSFIEKIRKATHGDKAENPSEWEVFVSYNRVGGFRQIVLRNGKLIFTRISQSTSLQTPDAVGTNISQEAANTLEYIRRIGYYDQTISVYVICSKESTSFVDIPGIRQSDVYVYSPYELAQKIGLETAAQESDKFGDVIFAANFVASKKKAMRLSTPDMKSVEKFQTISEGISYATYACMVGFPLISAYLAYSIFSQMGEMDTAEGRLRAVQAQRATLKDFEKEYGANPVLVKDMVKIEKELSAKDAFIKEVLTEYKQADKYSEYVSGIQYSTENSVEKIVLKPVFTFAQRTIYSDVLNNMELYTNDVMQAFAGNTVTIEGKPSEKDIKVDLDSDATPQPITLTVTIINQPASPEAGQYPPGFRR